MEQAERGPVVGQHRRSERLVAPADREPPESAGEDLAQAMVLPGVLDREGQLGLEGSGPGVVAGHGHDLVADHGHQGVPAFVVDVGQPQQRGPGRSRDRREEPEVHALGGEPFEEAREAVDVAEVDRSQCDRSAVDGDRVGHVRLLEIRHVEVACA